MMNHDWPLVPLGELFSRNDKTISMLPDERYQEVTIRLWGKGVVLRGIVTGADIPTTRRYQVSAQQFIVSRIDARNGAMGIVPLALDSAIVTNDFPSFNIDAGRLLPDYMGWLCKTADFVDKCRAASEGTTNRVRLKEDRFLRLTIPLPPLSEQRRIVARIDRLAAKISEAEGLRKALVHRVESFERAALSQLEDETKTVGQHRLLIDLIESHDSGWSPQCEVVPAEMGQWGVLKTTSVQWSGFLASANNEVLTI